MCDMGGEGSPLFRDINPVSQTSQNPADARMRLLNANANEHPLRIKYPPISGQE
jgi:hypothetical protein